MARKILTCPDCSSKFDVTKFQTGTKVKCGRCQKLLTVPPDQGAPVVAPMPGTASRGVLPQPAPRPAPTSSRSVPAPANPSTRTGTSGLSGPAAAPPATMTGDADPLVGRVVNNQYRIVKKLGEGGYGAVYEAKDINLERRVAIKIMLQARAQSREYVAKFLREARTAAQLSHPNVVAIHGTGFDKETGVHFLAMEYVEGRTIHDVLQERGVLPLDEACNYIIQSCRGLQAAHERNIIHRDIKPGNLMITPGGAIKITDFGLAKVYESEAAVSTVIGTPYFMPPEQFEGRAKDGRTDIYALGITFYYMLTMQRPHTGAGPAQILLSVMTKEPPSVREHRPELPEGCWAIVKRMIHRDSEKRYATCNEIIADLERLLGGGEEDVEQIYCPNCGVPNALEAVRCSGCGESLQETCPLCKNTDAAGTKFCGNCGANIPLERAVAALIDEAQEFLRVGRLGRARDKLDQARERSPHNVRVAQSLRELEARREQRDTHRDAIRDLLAQGQPEKAHERWETARAEFPESSEITDLENDVNTAMAARASAGSASSDAAQNAKRIEGEGQFRQALVAWRGVLVLLPGNEEALQGEARTRERVEQADSLAASAAASLQAGDPESAAAHLAEAAAILPKDPLIEGKRREVERALRDLRSEMEAAEKALDQGATEGLAERLRPLLSRHPGSARLRALLERAENAGRAATAGAARERLRRLLDTGRRAEEAKRLRDAAAAYREAAGLDPGLAEASDGLARVQRVLAECEAVLAQSRALLASGDPDGALAAAQQAANRVTGDPAVDGQLARSRTSLETLRHEADRIRAALVADPDEDVQGWARELAERFPGSATAAELLRAAEKVFREAEEKAADSKAGDLLARAQRLELDKQFERAAAAYEEAVRAAPANAAAKKALAALRERLAGAARKSDEAQARLDAGDPESALALAEAAHALLPDQVRTAGVMSAARTALGEIVRAEESFDADPSIAVDRAEAQLERIRRLRAKFAGTARCATLQSRAEQVLETARRSEVDRRAASRTADARRSLAAGRLSETERACGEVLSLQDDHPDAKAMMAEIAERRRTASSRAAAARRHQESGRLAEALREFDAALAEDAENGGARVGRETVAAALEQLRDQVRKLEGEAARAERAGRRREALAAWGRLAEVDPSHAKVHEEIARLRAWTARADEAIAAVRAILDAGDPEAALTAAQEARTRLGEWDEIEEMIARCKTLVAELDRAVRDSDRALKGPPSGYAAAAGATNELLLRFPGSRKVRDAAARATAAIEEERRAVAVAKLRQLVRDRRFGEAVHVAADLRAEGITGEAFEAAEAQARRVVDEAIRLQSKAEERRAAGDLEGALSLLRQAEAAVPDDPSAKERVRAAEESIRQFSGRLESIESSRRRGDLARALEACREALALSPGASPIREKMATIEAERVRRTQLLRECENSIAKGDADACARTSQQILSLFPEDESARNLQKTGLSMKEFVDSLLAHAKRQRSDGETESARSALECVLRIAPQHAEARALLGR